MLVRRWSPISLLARRRVTSMIRPMPLLLRQTATDKVAFSLTPSTTLERRLTASVRTLLKTVLGIHGGFILQKFAFGSY